MAQQRKRGRPEPSRKEQQMTLREREQARRLIIIVGAVLALVAVLVVGALAYQFLVLPNSAVAVVDGESITTEELANRSKFIQAQYSNQLANLLNLQDQFDPSGTQGFFTSQIQQLQGLLINPEGLANQTLETMIDERVLQHAAAAAGVAVSDAEVRESIEEVIAGGLGGVTAPQATATAEALAVATATPSPTPSPTPTTTVTITPTATPLPTPTVQVLTAEEIEQSYQEQLANIAETSGLTEAQYRQLFVNDLLRVKLVEALGDQMPTTGERVQASHILLSVPEDAGDAVEQETLARAISITQQLKNGADFATLAEQYSEDPGSAANGGDLGFFGRGMMVPEFEEAAYALDIGEISEPVRSQFGYHIIMVTDKDQGEPDFDRWFQDRKTEAAIERRLTNARLPTLPDINPALFQQVTQPVALPTVAAAPAEQ